MKKILKSSVLAAAIIGCGATGALATPALYDWAFNIDGTVTTDAVDFYVLTGMPVTGTLDSTTNLGTLTWSTSAFGSHSFLAFFDYEIDEAVNTSFDESGTATGLLGDGQSWEIGDPWNDFIYDDFTNGSLTNANSLLTDLEDVSMAMGWDFTLGADEMATITLTLSETEPTSGFYLTHSDPGWADSSILPSSFYFSGKLVISDGNNPEVPEPGTMLLMGAGLAGLLGVSRRKKNK